MSETIFNYRKLIVWQKAMQLTEIVYEAVKKFPPEERYALSDQLRRAVVSIASNIAEGAGRATNKDYAHFIAIARGSVYETMTQLETAVRIGYISAADFTSKFESLASEIVRMLGGAEASDVVTRHARELLAQARTQTSRQSP